MEKGVPIRSLSRGMAVLQAINRGGSLTMMAIARDSKVPYPTAVRIVQTLIHEGFVEQEPARKQYRPTALVQSLANGFDELARLTQVARPRLVALTHALDWPVALATPAGPSMVIRDSTHSITGLTFSQYHPGYTLPMLECASGLAYLAFSPEGERRHVLDLVRSASDSSRVHLLSLAEEGRLLVEIRRLGFASRGNNRFTRDPGKTSSIAAPILCAGRPIAALCLSFFSSAMPMHEAVSAFSSPLKTAALRIGDDYERGPTAPSSEPGGAAGPMSLAGGVSAP